MEVFDLFVQESSPKQQDINKHSIIPTTSASPILGCNATAKKATIPTIWSEAEENPQARVCLETPVTGSSSKVYRKTPHPLHSDQEPFLSTPIYSTPLPKYSATPDTASLCEPFVLEYKDGSNARNRKATQPRRRKASLPKEHAHHCKGGSGM